MHHHDTMKTIPRAYLGNQACSYQETVYHILPELKLRRIFPTVQFVDTNLLEKRIQILLPQKERSKLPKGSQNIFKRSNIDCYMEKPSATLCNGKYNVLNDFRYAEFLAYYTREDKSYLTCENYSDVLDDNMIESNHE